MRRALLVSAAATPGGAERVLAALARLLPEHGWEPATAVLADGPLVRELAAAGSPVEVLDAGRFRSLPRTAVTVARLARRARAADVVVSNLAKAHVYGGSAAAAARRPAVWWQHLVPERSRIELAAAAVPAAAIVCVGKEAAAAQRRLTPRRELVTIPPGIPVDAVASVRGSGAELRRRHGWNGATVVGIVARLQPWKGQELFLDAAARVARDREDVRFAVVGGAVLGWEGDYPERLRSRAEALGIGDRVHFAGHQQDPFPWLDALDVVVNASAREPFGLSLVEAMALGKPVVAVGAGGPAEIVEDGRSGLLLPAARADALADALRLLLDDRDLARRIGAAAAERARAFDEATTASRFAELLERVAR